MTRPGEWQSGHEDGPWEYTNTTNTNLHDTQVKKWSGDKTLADHRHEFEVPTMSELMVESTRILGAVIEWDTTSGRW